MSHPSPLISVVVPAYNCDKTIVQTIESVFQQTYKNVEILVINDGSTDDTRTILEQIEDSRLKILTFPNSGVSVSRNRGLANSKGDFIAFLDADDIWLSNKLRQQLDALVHAPQASVAYSWTNYIDQSGQLIRQGHRCRYSGSVYQKMLFGSFLTSGSNPLIRRHAIENIGGFDESLVTCEDWDLFLRLALSYEFVVVPEVHINYRISTKSKSFQLDKHEAGGLTVIHKALAEAPPEIAPLKGKIISNFYKYLLFKVLDAPSENYHFKSRYAWSSLKYLSLSVYQDPNLLLQIKVLGSALIKIIIILIWSNLKSLGSIFCFNQGQESLT